MATPEQRQALMSTGCPWCGAAPGEVCTMPSPGGRARRDHTGGVRRGQRVGISTLDGGCHDARWQAAGLGSAPVLAAVLAERQQVEGVLRRVQEPAMAAAGGPPEPSGADRPW